jgi:hypothetical protein
MAFVPGRGITASTTDLAEGTGHTVRPRGQEKIVCALERSAICMHNRSQIILSHVGGVAENTWQRPDRFYTRCRAPRCIMCARDLRMLALVFGLCRWSANWGRLLVVYANVFISLNLVPRKTNAENKHAAIRTENMVQNRD